jgi:excisionase family DNA binding protein
MNRLLQTFPSVDTPRAPESPASVVVNGLGDELLTVNDAARLLHVTVSWVYEHTREDADDRLPFVKLGKYVRFDRTDLREYVNAKRQAARSAARRR